MTPPTTVVFVHGAWHGPWCWSEWVEVAEARGHETVAVTLPGHDRPGTSARIWNRIGEMITAVEDALDAPSGPTVVVAHSMGGYPVQRAMAPEHDAIFSVAQQRDLAAEHGVDPVVIEGAGHDVMLEAQSPEAAAIVLGWAEQRFAEATA